MHIAMGGVKVVLDILQLKKILTPCNGRHCLRVVRAVDVEATNKL